MATVATYNASAPSGGLNMVYMGTGGSNTSRYGEVFKPSSNYTLTSGAFTLAKESGATGTLVARIYATTGTYGSSAKPTGVALATSDAVAVSALSAYPTFSSETFTFSGANQIVLKSNTIYAIVCEPTDPDHIVINSDNTGPSYSGNAVLYVSGSWSGFTGEDAEFTVSGTQITTLYWIGGTGNWSDSAHWSLTSGGSSAGIVPDYACDAIFDANSFSANDQVVSITSSSSCKDLDTSTVAYDIDISRSSGATSSATLNIYGNVALSASTRLLSEVYNGFYTLAIWMNGSGVTFDQAGAVVWCSITIRSTSTVTLSSDLVGPRVTITDIAEFTSAGYALDLPAFVANSGTTIDLAGSAVTIQEHPHPDTGDIAAAGVAVSSSATATLTTSSITINDDLPLYGGGKTYPLISFDGSTHTITDSNTFTELDIAAGATIKFTNGTTQTVTTFDTHGTDSSKVLLRSDVAGSKWTISKASGTVDAYFLDIKDSTATGGATWNATSSIDSGNNTGWNFLTPTIAPSGIASAEAFGTLTVAPATVTITMTGIASAEAFGTFTTTLYASGFGGIASAEAFGTATLTQSDPPPPPPPDWSAIGQEDKKEYLYKVYDSAGTYIGVWTDVDDEPQFTRRLNEAGTTMTVRLARSANTLKEVRSTRITQDGNIRITQDSKTRVTVTHTANTVGEDTDVDLNYNVDVYVQYGGFNTRVTQDGKIRITQDGNTRVVTYGSPLGTRIFSGYIMDYTSTYGEHDGVSVTLASHGAELSQEIIRSGTTTTVTYSTTEVATQIKNILDTNPGKMTYDSSTINNTGVSPTLTYRLNTKLEGIESAYNQSPDGWYWFGGVADPLVVLKSQGVTADHTFYLGQHIKNIEVKRSLESLVNAVWFVGGDSGGTPVYKYYEDATSQSTWRKGVYRITDARYTNTTSMANRANKQLGRYKDPIFTTPVTITSGRYDIETIELGQMIGFRNFGNFIDNLLLQVVSLSYTPTAVTLELGELQDRQVDIVGDIQEDTANSTYETLPTAPS